MKRKIPVTHIPLQTYAAYMGINPLHFEGAVSQGLFQNMGYCDDVWHRHTWQSVDDVSHEDLAIQIRDAEKTVSRHLGYNIAPEWQVVEVAYPKRREGLGYMRELSGAFRTLNLQRGRLISGGKRGTEFFDNLSVTYEDRDGDQFSETAVIDVGQEFDWREIKVYYQGTNGDQAWEIKPLRTIEGTKLIYDSWLFIDPEVKSKIPMDSIDPINISNQSNLVTSIDVYREYNNIDTPSCTFIWDLDGKTQDGFLQVVDQEAGVVRPMPATYTYGISCTVVPAPHFCRQTEPDRVRMYIYSGNQSDDYLNGYSYDPVDSFYVESVRLLATARLDRDLCGCTNVAALAKELRQDMALVSPQGNFLAVADAIQECPFGTRRGEWLAWHRLNFEQDKFFSVATV